MAVPTILFDSNNGSGTASGAGPSTALSGTSASFSAGTVTLDGSPNLSGVDTTGLHVLLLNTTTGVRFFKITGSANSGTPSASVTVTPNPAGTASGLTWAIGGKRTGLFNNSTSILLFDNGGAAGDAQPGWIMEMASGHVESINSRATLRNNGDQTTGPITIRGAIGAVTPPLLQFTSDDIAILIVANYWRLDGFQMICTAGTHTASVGVQCGGGDGTVLRRLKIQHSSSRFLTGVKITVTVPLIDRCEIGNTYGNAILGGTGGSDPIVIVDNYIHDTGSDAIDFASVDSMGSGVIRNNIIANVTGIGLRINGGNSNTFRAQIIQNTFYNTSSDGFKHTGTNDWCTYLVVENNIFDTIGGWGMNLVLSAQRYSASGATFRNNNFHSCTSGKYTPTDLESIDEQTLDPQFTNAGTGDFTIGTNLRALGFPTAAVGS